MQHVHAGQGVGDLEVDADRAQRGVRIGQPSGRQICGDAGLGSSRSEAVHLDIDEAAQLAGEELDMDSSATVYLWGVFAGEDADSHVHDPTAISRLAPGYTPRLG